MRYAKDQSINERKPSLINTDVTSKFHALCKTLPSELTFSIIRVSIFLRTTMRGGLVSDACFWKIKDQKIPHVN